MRPLIDITADVQRLLDVIDDGGELSPELEAWFAALGDERAEKVDQLAGLIRTLELRAAARQEEIERLAKRVTADSNAARRIKDRLRDHLIATGTRRLETRRYTVSVQANGGLQGVDVMVPAEQLSAQYQRVKVEADQDAIRKALLAGEVVDGAVLQSRGQHLRIR